MVSYPNFLQVYFKDFDVLILVVVDNGLVHQEWTDIQSDGDVS